MYLVTGGSGFCGLEIVRYLLEAGEKIRLLDQEQFPEPSWKVDYFAGDIRQIEDVKKACQGVKIIIHTAAKVPISKAGKEFWHVNVDGTRNVLEAALQLGIRKVVHISSSSVQSMEPSPVHELAPFSPVGEYAHSKKDAELVCQEYIQKGLNVDIIRPRTVVGKGRLGIFSILFDWIADGKRIYVLGSGKNRMQFLHSRDLAKGCYLASRSSGSQIYNLGSKKFTTLREDLEALIRFAGTKSRVIGLPISLAAFALRILDLLHLSPLSDWHYKTYHHDFFFNNEHAIKYLKWEPEYGNVEILCEAYQEFINDRAHSPHASYGHTHRQSLKQGALRILKWLS